jgi:sugar/nucleoside kinase (ribokinase family)
MSKILVVGSVAYDTISTPGGRAENILGGSANYFSLAASLFSEVNVVGVVGEDYRPEDLRLLEQRQVDLSGLQKVAGKTFHWEGRYEFDMNEAITVETQLNVFKDFNPTLPEHFKKSPFVFLANIDPELQMRVLEQIESPKLVGADSMNFWIKSKPESLRKVLSKIDVLLINEGEARDLTGNWNIVQAVKEIAAMGPRAVVVKRGEYGFVMLFEGKYFILPAYPVSTVVDPTGAGDTFAGGFFGYLSKQPDPWSFFHFKQACVQGCLTASFTVQDFGVNALIDLNWAKVEERFIEYKKVIDCLN